MALLPYFILSVFKCTSDQLKAYLIIKAIKCYSDQPLRPGQGRTDNLDFILLHTVNCSSNNLGFVLLHTFNCSSDLSKVELTILASFFFMASIVHRTILAPFFFTPSIVLRTILVSFFFTPSIVLQTLARSRWQSWLHSSSRRQLFIGQSWLHSSSRYQSFFWQSWLHSSSRHRSLFGQSWLRSSSRLQLFFRLFFKSYSFLRHHSCRQSSLNLRTSRSFLAFQTGVTSCHFVWLSVTFDAFARYVSTILPFLASVNTIVVDFDEYATWHDTCHIDEFNETSSTYWILCP